MTALPAALSIVAVVTTMIGLAVARSAVGKERLPQAAYPHDLGVEASVGGLLGGEFTIRYADGRHVTIRGLVGGEDDLAILRQVIDSKEFRADFGRLTWEKEHGTGARYRLALALSQVLAFGLIGTAVTVIPAFRVVPIVAAMLVELGFRSLRHEFWAKRDRSYIGIVDKSEEATDDDDE